MGLFSNASGEGDNVTYTFAPGRLVGALLYGAVGTVIGIGRG